MASGRVSVFRTHAEVAIAAGRRPRTPVTAGARTPSDLTYLGGGVRVAGDEELSTFDAVKAGVARTARGELPSDGLPDEGEEGEGKGGWLGRWAGWRAGKE
eukprot:346788-Chlamydomonas_euryale.AAC.4